MKALSANGTLLEKYAYAPFGGNIGVDSAHVGFSSEVAESGLGLMYYNYRYLVPRNGKWIKRDSIMEDGGLNLYSIKGNNCIGFFDINGNFVITLPVFVGIIAIGGAVSTIIAEWNEIRLSWILLGEINKAIEKESKNGCDPEVLRRLKIEQARLIAELSFQIIEITPGTSEKGEPLVW